MVILSLLIQPGEKSGLFQNGSGLDEELGPRTTRAFKMWYGSGNKVCDWRYAVSADGRMADRDAVAISHPG